MSLSLPFRRSFCESTRRRRRRAVALFCVCLLVALLEAACRWEMGSKATLLVSALWLTAPYLGMLRTLQAVHARLHRGVIVLSPDDRAFLRYGREFDYLEAQQQECIAETCTIGPRRVFPTQRRSWTERSGQGRARATGDSRRILFLASIPATFLYMASCRLLPAPLAQSLADHWPMLLLATTLGAAALPDLLWAWREPDTTPVDRYDLREWQAAQVAHITFPLPSNAPALDFPAASPNAGTLR